MQNNKITNYNKQTIILILIGLFISLFIHDSNLYPHLNLINTFILSFLRLILLTIPLITGFLVIKFKDKKTFKFLFLFIWILFLSYTIYSMAEIRHIAELCKLPKGSYYTESCVTKSWTLLPTFIYSTIGSLLFVFSVYQVTSNLISNSWKKRIAIIVLCLTCSFSSVFGLYTRINTWEIFTNPLSIIQSLISTIHQEGFIFNFFIFSLFTIGYFFTINRLLRQYNKYVK